jgi:hypothetical protein
MEEDVPPVVVVPKASSPAPSPMPKQDPAAAATMARAKTVRVAAARAAAEELCCAAFDEIETAWSEQVSEIQLRAKQALRAGDKIQALLEWEKLRVTKLIACKWSA